MDKGATFFAARETGRRPAASWVRPGGGGLGVAPSISTSGHDSVDSITKTDAFDDILETIDELLLSLHKFILPEPELMVRSRMLTCP